MHKEGLTRLGINLAMTGLVAFSSGCSNEALPIPSQKPGISRTITPELAQSPWEDLPASERIQKLIIKDYPYINGFDRQEEVMLATVQSYCEQIECVIPAEKIVKDIYYVNADEFIEKLIPELFNQSLTPEETEREKTTRLAITTSKGKVYVNQPLMDTIVKDIIANQPDMVKQLAGKDIRTIYEISTLAHELTHKNKHNIKDAPVKFEGFSIRLPKKTDPINFDTLDGFKIEGRDTSNKSYFIIGGDEAITDFAAYIITEKKMGIPYISVPEYRFGALLIEKLNRMAGISDDEFLKYANGQLPSEDLLKRWGAFKRDPSRADIKEGILALRMVGLAVQGVISFPDAQAEIKSRLKL